MKAPERPDVGDDQRPTMTTSTHPHEGPEPVVHVGSHHLDLHHLGHHRRHPPSASGKVIAVVAMYELTAIAVNDVLDDDVLPSFTSWLETPWLPGSITRLVHAGRTATMWGILVGTAALVALSASSRRSSPTVSTQG